MRKDLNAIYISQGARSMTQDTRSRMQNIITKSAKFIPHGYKSLARQTGLSTVELALMLSLLVPMTIAMTYAGQFLHRSWQMEETASMAVRYVGDIDPASQISQPLIDEQISMRCQRLTQAL